MADALRTLRSLAGSRLLSVDPGSRYFGLAVRTSQLEGVRPYGLIERIPVRRGVAATRGAGGAAWDWALQRELSFGGGGGRARFSSLANSIAHVLQEQQLAAAVVGMPYHADGSRSAECAAVEQLVAQLRAAWKARGVAVPVLLWDESWSTRIAMAGSRRRQRNARCSHARAACVILQEVVDTLRPVEDEGNKEPKS